jgi:2-phosphosulfolactate phosphatase
LAGGTSVVIDVLRATTTIVHALAAGARAVVPCATIEEANQRAAALPAGTAVRGGERGGLAIAGFDLGNSPAEYNEATVGGKIVLLTTTNGTKALLHCRRAAQVVVAAFVNLSAAVTVVSDEPRLDIVCAGTDGGITGEDVLAAGALVRKVLLHGSWRANDEAWIAQDVWSRFAERPELLAEALRASHGGQNLLALGMAADIERSAEIDRYDVVPRFDAASGEITLGEGPLAARSPSEDT